MKTAPLAPVLLLGLLTTAARADDLAVIRSRIISLYDGAAAPAGSLQKEAVQKTVEEAQKLLNRADEWPKLDDPKAPQFERAVQLHYNHLLTLAQAYASPGSNLQHSQPLRTRIELELKNGLKTIQPGSPHPGNWYEWIIGIPRALGPALLLLGDDIDPALKKQCVEAMADLVQEPNLSGANAVWQARDHVYLAVLQNDPRRMARAAEYLQREISIGRGGSGIQEDYSYQFHGNLLHTSGYGSGYAYSAAEFAYLCDQTAYAMPEDRKTLLINHLLEHARWTVVGTYYDLSVRGRGVLSTTTEVAHLDAILLLAAIKPAQTAALQDAAASLIAGGARQLPLTTAALADALPAPASRKPLTGFRHFYASDFAVQRTPEFYASVRMYSSRMIDYEGNFGQNYTGWFLTYGLTYFSRTGDELWRDGAIASKEYDWDRLPGTTSRPGVHPPKSYNVSTSDFAGGAGGDAETSGGMAGFVLVPAAGDFTANKSYFFFDRGFVALGSNIHSTAQHAEPIVTTITQWAAAKPDLPLRLSNNRTVSAIDAGDHAFEDVQFAWHDNVGYLFLKPVTLHTHRRKQLLTLWLDHSVAVADGPADAAYAYVVLPNASYDETEKLAAKWPVRIVQQDGEGHVVETADGSATGAVLWKQGRTAVVTASAPAVVYVEKRGAGQVVSFEDPLHGRGTLLLELPGLGKAVDLPGETKAEQVDGVTRIAAQVTNGRVYRAGFGAGTVRQQPREDGEAALGMTASAALEGDAVIVTVKVPAALMKDAARLVIRGPQGHLRGELTEHDVVSRDGAGVVSYRWMRQPGAKVETVLSATIFSGLHQAAASFTLPEREKRP